MKNTNDQPTSKSTGGIGRAKPWFLQVAKTMLGADTIWEIHPELAEELLEINAMTKRAPSGGHLYSRQVIACAIINWQKRNPDKESVIKGTTDEP